VQPSGSNHQIFKLPNQPMLINLSNHPSERWSDVQKNAAIESYGHIEDLSFPNIAPSLSAAELMQVVREYFEKVKEKAPKAVHLMGEMTFTATLVQLLQQEGIQVIASTSERQVLEEEDGKKMVIFKFVQFREYPPL
jgi:hypothetical protein